MSFLVRDLEKRLLFGDVEGVHEGARQIAALADNLWSLGEKRRDPLQNRATLNGYMNLLKNVAGELKAYGGKEDLESGRAQLTKVREAFALLQRQYRPRQETSPPRPSGVDSSGANAPEKPGTGPDSVRPVKPR
jgi:hypothetical protein